MARIPILQSPTAQATGNATIKTPNLPAVTNAALGEGLSNIGQAGFKMIEMKNKADDISNVTTATLSMNDADKQFLDYQRSPEGMNDDANWAAKWSELSTKVANDTKSMALTPQARLQLESKLSNWSTNGSIRVQADVFKQSEARVINSIESLINAKKYDEAAAAAEAARSVLPGTQVDGILNKTTQQKQQDLRQDLTATMEAANKGDPEAIKAIPEMLEEAKKAGAITPVNFGLALKGNERTKLFREDSDLRYADPKQHILKLKNRNYLPEISEEDRSQLTNLAENVLIDYQKGEQKNIVDKVLDGSINNAEQVQPYYIYMDKSQQTELEKIFINPAPTDKSSADIIYSRATNLIRSYDKNQDPENTGQIEIASLIARLKKFDPTMTLPLTDQFNEALKKGAPDGYSKHSSVIHQTLTESRQGGFFGDPGDDKKPEDYKKRSDTLMKQHQMELEIEDIYSKLPPERQTWPALQKIYMDVYASRGIKVGAARLTDERDIDASMFNQQSPSGNYADLMNRARQVVPTVLAKEKELNSPTKSK
jgi:hypothetical protein